MDRAANDSAREALLRACCRELEDGLRGGRDARTEDLLRRHPELAGDRDASIELAYAEFTLLEALGLRPAAADFCARFPLLKEGLADQLQLHALLRSGEQPAEEAPAVPFCIAARSDPALGSFGPYDLLEVTARGATGVVYKARRRTLKRIVAVKLIAAGADLRGHALRRFHTEAEATARLNHPNIVQLYDVGQVDEQAFLALEFVGGGDLASELRRRPPSPRQAAEWGRQLACAVAHAHDRGILHRDLKPGNVLLTQDYVPKIADFGLARLLDRDGRDTQTGEVCGTPCYMAPEQAQGDAQGVGPTADIYSLGAILYEMLCGKPPFSGGTLLETLRCVLEEPPAPPERLRPGVPRDLATICLKCLAKEPGRRYASAQALADDLGRYLRGEPIAARRTGAWRRTWMWSRRRPATALAAAVLVAICCGAAWYGGQLAALRRAAAEARLAVARSSQREADHRQVALAAVLDAADQREAAAEADAAVQQMASEVLAARKAATAQQARADQDAARLAAQADYGRRLAHGWRLSEVARLWRSQANRALGLLVDPELFPPELRDETWRQLERACRQDRRLQTGHMQGISALACNETGTLAATAGVGENVVRLWDVQQGSLVSQWTMEQGEISSLAFSPCESSIAIGFESGLVLVRPAVAGVADQRTFSAVDGEAEGPVHDLTWSPDGRGLAWGSGADLLFWRPHFEMGPQSVCVHTAAIRSIAFEGDGLQLAAGSDDGTCSIWAIGPLGPVSVSRRIVSPHGASVRRAAFIGADRLAIFAAGMGILKDGGRRTEGGGKGGRGEDGAEWGDGFDVMMIGSGWGCELADACVTEGMPLAAVLEPGARISVRNLATGDVLFSIEELPADLDRLRFAANGRLLLASGAGAEVAIWSLIARLEEPAVGTPEWLWSAPPGGHGGATTVE